MIPIFGVVLKGGKRKITDFEGFLLETTPSQLIVGTDLMGSVQNAFCV